MSHSLPPLAVYVHLPWCVSKCPYCDFNSHTLGASPPFDAYVDALARDIAAESTCVSGREVDTVFIGGGTPSLFSPAHIASLMQCLRSHLVLAPKAEVTMEANPGAVERGSLLAYREAGVTRLSLGVQSFQETSLRRLGRIHGPDDALRAFEEARRAAFDSINLDLMFALPGQTEAMAMDDVRRATALGAEHISYYQLTLEPNTVFYARPPEGLPDADRGFALQEAGLEHLAARGYERYEVSAFCRPGQACRHNLNYWSFGDYLGVGAGAHGKVTDEAGQVWRTVKVAHPASYVRQSASEGPERSARRLRADDILFEFMLNALRLSAGFTTALFAARTGLDEGSLLPRLRAVADEGLLACSSAGTWRPTELGYRFLDDLQARFLPRDSETSADVATAESAG